MSAFACNIGPLSSVTCRRKWLIVGDKLPGIMLSQVARARGCMVSEDTSRASRLHHLPTSPLSMPPRTDLPRSRLGFIQQAAALEHQTSHAVPGSSIGDSRSDTQRQSKLPRGVLQHQMPKHVALIMDGNSRWATARGLPAWVGHERGVAALRQAVISAWESGIQALTVYAFSLENWQRDAEEVTFLMNLFQSALQQQLPELQQRGVRLHFMGELHRLPHTLQHHIADCEAATADNTQLLLNVAVSYSAQQDMVSAVQQIAQQVQQGELMPEQITPALLSRHLASSTATAAAGPPDLLIRTSGEQRLSNFMLWECAYTELCFQDVMWPDFDKQRFEKALQQYAQRQRRFGTRS